MSESNVIYLDNHATTPLDPRVLESMMPYLTRAFGNAASTSHVFGWEARDAVEVARLQVANLIGASPTEIVFTSGATESDNLALKGAVSGVDSARIVTCETEHKAVLDCVGALGAAGADVSVLGVDAQGRIDPEEFRAAVGEPTRIVSIMAANNEIGTVHELSRLAEATRECGALFHSDAAQALTTEAICVRETGVDMLSMSTHKMYGPKGVGALFVRRGIQDMVAPEMFGGGHERGLRSGTLNVAGIVGFGAAAAIVTTERESEASRVAGLRDRLEATLFGRLRGLRANGDLDHRLVGNSSLTFEGIDSQTLLNRLRTTVAASTGSACSSATPEPSHVLAAIGLDQAAAEATVRFGIGRMNTAEDVDHAAVGIVAEVAFLQSSAAVGGRR